MAPKPASKKGSKGKSKGTGAASAAVKQAKKAKDAKESKGAAKESGKESGKEAAKDAAPAKTPRESADEVIAKLEGEGVGSLAAADILDNLGLQAKAITLSFLKSDTDASGELTKAEVKASLLIHHPDTSDTDIDALFKVLDKDGNNTLSQIEYAVLFLCMTRANGDFSELIAKNEEKKASDLYAVEQKPVESGGSLKPAADGDAPADEAPEDGGDDEAPADEAPADEEPVDEEVPADEAPEDE